jgi:hypothetical protein
MAERGGERKTYLLRLDPRLHAVLERWAADDLRSLNGQLEFLLTEAARRAGRLKLDEREPPAGSPNPG